MSSTFGKLLVAHRNRAGLASEELASRLGVHRNSITNWERGRSVPKRATVLKLGNILSLTKSDVDELLASVGYAAQHQHSVPGEMPPPSRHYADHFHQLATKHGLAPEVAELLLEAAWSDLRRRQAPLQMPLFDEPLPEAVARELQGIHEHIILLAKRQQEILTALHPPPDRAAAEAPPPLPDPLPEPTPQDSLDHWFDYLHDCTRRGRRFTLRDVAHRANHAYSYVRKQHVRYKKQRAAHAPV